MPQRPITRLRCSPNGIPVIKLHGVHAHTQPTAIQTGVFKDALRNIDSARSQFPGPWRYFPEMRSRCLQGLSYKRVEERTLICPSHTQTPVTFNSWRGNTLVSTATERHGKGIMSSYPQPGRVCGRDSMTSPQVFHHKKTEKKSTLQTNTICHVSLKLLRLTVRQQ